MKAEFSYLEIEKLIPQNVVGFESAFKTISLSDVTFSINVARVVMQIK